MTTFICEDTFEGILTAVYDAWDSRLGHDNVKLQTEGYISYELFTEYVTVETDLEKSTKVSNSIKNKISGEVHESIYSACLSEDTQKADAIYRFIILGFKMGKDVINCFTDDNARKIFELNRNVMNEAHLLKGFVRFSELKNKVLLARINPQNDVLALISTHFEDRLPLENWAIYDYKRNKASIHQAGCQFYIALDTTLLADVEKLKSEEEATFQAMWKTFFEAIAIKERINPRLQTQMLRKRFRSNMTEFQDNV